MKIVCQSCSATYKIADEKVQGKKVFKIKCKKCGEDILVRGTDLAAEPAAPQEDASVGGDAVWHAVVNGDQQGPFSVAQLQAMLGEGSIDGETYVWREGFEGWLPIVQVDELSSLLSPSASLSDSFPAAPEEPTVAAGADLFASLVPPTAEPAPATSSGLFGALDTEAATRVSASVTAKTRPVKAAGGDLFAVEVRQQEAAKPLFTEEPAAAKDAPKGEHLTGQRNENSVLFSLATLQQLSGDDKDKAAGANAAMSGSGDASGLIDINKLSGALKGDTAAKKSSIDDILSVGASSGLGAPLTAPLLTPVAVPVAPAPAPVAPSVAPAPQKSNAIVWVAAAGILGAAVLGAAFIVKSRGDEATPAVAQAPAAPAPAAPNPNAVTPPTPAANPEAANPAPAPAPAPAPTAAPSAPAAPTAAAPSAERPRDRERDRERDRRPSTTAAAPAPAAPAPAAAAARTAPPPARRPAGGGSVDDLMNAVVAGRPAAAASAPAPSSNVPDTPDRSAVIGALRGVGPAVRACGTGAGGVATVTIVFNNQGNVNTATVAPPVTGAQASCVVSAVRRAHIPAFGRPTFSVTYPFALQ